jgi:glycosyltransferase involved in cell wall biosynthesis
MVQPRNGEGISIAVLEAMMVERAIVASDASALPDIIDDEDVYPICRILHVDDLAGKIAILVRDLEMRRLDKRAGKLFWIV